MIKNIFSWCILLYYITGFSQNSKDIILYPNTANTETNLLFNNGINVKDISVFDSQGRLVKKIAVTSKSTYNIDTRTFSKGLYYISITTPQETIVKKLMIAPRSSISYSGVSTASYFPSAYVALKASNSTNFTPIHDAYLQGNSLINSAIVRVENNYRKGYLMYNLNGVSEISSAKLKITIASDPGSGTLSVYKGNGTNWTETSLSSSTKPSQGNLLGSINTSYIVGKTYEITLNKSQLTNGKISLIVIHSSGNDTDFASKEHKSLNPATLELVKDSENSGTGTTTLNPVQDTYLQGSSNIKNTVIRAESNYRKGYLMYNLNGVSGITSAQLSITVASDPGNGTISVYKGNSNNWSESNLNLTNKPNQDIFLGSISGSFMVGNTYKIPLNKNELNSGLQSLIVVHGNGNDFDFAAKEHRTLNPAQLILNAGTTPTPAPSPTPPSSSNTFYVTVSGKASNSGKTESSAWSLEHAITTAKAGNEVYVKAGNYGNKELLTKVDGSSGNPIRFIGYKNTPGDIVTNQGSTFNYGDSIDANKMPLLVGIAGQGSAITSYHRYIEFENFQITGYKRGVLNIERATNNIFKNIIMVGIGIQTHAAYDGFGFNMKGDNTVIENSFVLNAGAEAFSLSGVKNSRISYCKVYADNYSNPTDYYYLLAGGTNNAIIENSYAERVFELPHPGHGFMFKDLATYNTFKNCTVKNTNIELNFAGVQYNTIDNCTVIGRGTGSGDWEACVMIKNGANNNLIKNTKISNALHAIILGDDDDGYVAPDGDRDEVSLGYNNTFDNMTITNISNMIKIGGGNEFSAKASNYTLKNSTINQFDYVAIAFYSSENFKFQNCNFSNGENLVIEYGDQYAPYSHFNASWINCNWSNVNFTPPE